MAEPDDTWDGEAFRGLNPYLDWAARLVLDEGRITPGGIERLRAQGVAVSEDSRLYEPVFVRVLEGQSPAEFFAAAREASGYEVDPFEEEYDSALREEGAPVEAFLYRSLDEPKPPEFEERFDVLWVGPITARRSREPEAAPLSGTGPEGATPSSGELEGDRTPSAPATDPATDPAGQSPPSAPATRLAGQSPPSPPATDPAGGGGSAPPVAERATSVASSSSGKGSATSSDSPGEVALGIIDDGIAILHPRFRGADGLSRFRAVRFQHFVTPAMVLSKASIDAELLSLAQRSEQDIYAARARSFYGADIHHSMIRAASHGTPMLDLAGGADPASSDPMRSRPLYAVQLPPQAFDDTSGYRLQKPLVDGVRWLIHRALVVDGFKRLVLNVSLGIDAGPKDGTSWVERQIRREMDRPKVRGKVELVLAYGNAYEDRLVAWKELEPGTAAQLDLRVQPDDLTPSYVEIRLAHGSPSDDLARLRVTLTSPHGDQVGGLVVANAPPRWMTRAGRPMAGLYHRGASALVPGDRPVILIALAPTTCLFPGGLVCPGGRWRIDIGNEADARMEVTVQVQRDDSPFPRVTGARQARLDDPRAHEWDAARRDFGALAGLVTRAGSNSAYSTVPQPNVHAVGAARVLPGRVSPARYSAAGSTWSGAGPQASAVSEIAGAPPGVPASGNFPASIVRLSGTSGAAATWSRQLLTGGLPTGPGDMGRLGPRTVLDNPAIRRRPG